MPLVGIGPHQNLLVLIGMLLHAVVVTHCYGEEKVNEAVGWDLRRLCAAVRILWTGLLLRAAAKTAAELSWKRFVLCC